MTFEPIPGIMAGMDVWGATRDNYSFIVSIDHACGGEVRASVKVTSTIPFDNTRLDLGIFNTIDEAMTACREWRPA